MFCQFLVGLVILRHRAANFFTCCALSGKEESGRTLSVLAQAGIVV